MTTIYLIRHGETEHNKNGIIMGQIDSPLTDKGLETSKRLANKLQTLKFDSVYSSDLGRAFITAHIIVEQLQIEHKLSRAKELREINYGTLANTKKENVKSEYPEFKTDVSHIYPNGESFLQVQKRAVGFITKLKKEYPTGTILCVTHAGVLRSILTHFKNLDFQDHLHMKIEHEDIWKIELPAKGRMLVEKVSV